MSASFISATMDLPNKSINLTSSVYMNNVYLEIQSMNTFLFLSVSFLTRCTFRLSYHFFIISFLLILFCVQVIYDFILCNLASSFYRPNLIMFDNLWAQRLCVSGWCAWIRYGPLDYYKLEIFTGCCWSSFVSFPASFTTVVGLDKERECCNEFRLRLHLRTTFCQNLRRTDKNI